MQSLALPEDGSQYDYTSVANSYLRFFIDPEVFVTILNTTQTGYAHTSSGTDLEILMKHIMTSMCLCLVEVALFSYLRPIFKTIYQPRCYCTPEKESMEPLGDGFLDWLLHTWKHPIQHYLPMGLDAYFFLRFLNILLIFFATCGMFHMVVLIPVNFTGSSATYQATGLDKFSLSNISTEKVQRLNVHFVCALITVCMFNCFIFYELQSIVKIRQTYLNSPVHRLRDSSRVLLLSNVKGDLQNKEVIIERFRSFPGGLEHVWLVDNYSEYWWQWVQAQEALDILESFEILQLKRLVKRGGKLTSECLKNAAFHPPIYLPLTFVPFCNRYIAIRLPGFCRFVTFQKQQKVVEWCMNVLSQTHSVLLSRVVDIATDLYQKQENAFLKFSSQEATYMAHQTLLSLDFGTLNHSVIEVNPRDIIWENLIRKNSLLASLERYCISVILIVVICLYVVPVSLIGMFSDPQFVTQLFPFMAFIKRLPEEIRDTLASLVPALLLSLMTGLQLHIMRRLLHLKGSWTGSLIELSLQKWYFSFLFIQQFVVVSILSSLGGILIQIIEKPASIPLLLAANIPKSAIFFFKYLAVKAFTLCGHSFFRINDLLKQYIVFRWTDVTPRMKFRRMTTLKKVRWGSVYAAFSVYGAIGLTYCVISPLISLFMIVILLLVLLYFKYSLHYVYSHLNESETHGRLYPQALFHLYSGIYCLEFCMIGIFVSLRNQTGGCAMKFQTLVLVAALIFTVFGNVLAFSRFHRYFKYFPQFNPEVQKVEANSSDQDKLVAQQTLMYFHPCYRYTKPILWLPRDDQGECYSLSSDLLPAYDAIAGVSTIGALLLEEKRSLVLKLLSGPPTDAEVYE